MMSGFGSRRTTAGRDSRAALEGPTAPRGSAARVRNGWQPRGMLARLFGAPASRRVLRQSHGRLQTADRRGAWFQPRVVARRASSPASSCFCIWGTTITRHAARERVGVCQDSQDAYRVGSSVSALRACSAVTGIAAALGRQAQSTTTPEAEAAREPVGGPSPGPDHRVCDWGGLPELGHRGGCQETSTASRPFTTASRRSLRFRSPPLPARLRTIALCPTSISISFQT